MVLPVNFTRPFGLNSIVIITKKNFLSGGLSISQKQAVIKLIEKKGRDKRLIKTWRPISLLIHVFAKRIKKTFTIINNIL